MADDEPGAKRRQYPIEADTERPEVTMIDVRDLMGGAREAVLLHAGEHYRLRITANDKLILTK